MSIGTIVSDVALTVQYVRGANVGSVEESFANSVIWSAEVAARVAAPPARIDCRAWET